MNKVNIAFGGMTNVPDDSFSKDGDMSVLLNMRHKGGELVECKRPSEKSGDAKVEQLQYHAQSGLWLELRSGGSVYVNPNKGTLAPGPYTSFAIMGNIVIMYGTDYVHYAIWRNGGYVYLGELPDVPRLGMTVRKVRKFVDTMPSEFYANLYEAKGANRAELFNLYVKKGYIDQCLDQLYKDGGYVDRAQFRVALKLFDGSYVSYSPIYYANFLSKYDDNILLAQGGDHNFRWASHKDLTGDMPYYASVAGFIPTFDLSEYNMENWEDIIVSVCIFSSGSLPLHKAKKRTIGTWNSPDEQIFSREFEDYMLLTNEEKRRTMVEDVMFYLVAEYDLQGKRITLVEDTSPSYLATRDVLPDYSTAKQTIAGSVHVINSRLHASKTISVLNDGFADVSYFNEQNVSINISKIVAVTHITTDDGVKKVVKEIGAHIHWGNDITALLTYPDRRAFKMELYILKDGVLKYKAFDLVKHKTLDMAYWLYEEYSEETEVRINSSLSYDVTVVDEPGLLAQFGVLTDRTITVMYDSKYDGSLLRWEYEMAPGVWVPFPTEYLDIANLFPTKGDYFSLIITVTENGRDAYPLNEFSTATEGAKFHDATVEWQTINAAKNVKDFVVNVDIDNQEERKGILKVSAVDNPFFFPTAQTYKFEGDIVGLASNAEAISTGQFGAYPLFVFTKEGIWAMQIDTSGQGAYLSQSPFSREVCDGAVCPVSGGVVFTTKRGLMAISGGQVAELSKPLDGLEEMLFNFSGTLAGQIFARAGYDGYEKFEPVPIREYINGAKLAYNYLHNEVILSNPDKKYKYSYVYSLDNQTWGMIDTKFDITTNSYPELVVYNNNQMKRYAFDDASTESVPIVAITRPFTLGSLDFKRLRQAGLRTTFEGSLNFYLLGSNDGAEFKCITGKEVEDSGTYRDLITAMSRSKQYKYFAIAVVGNMSGRVSMAELLVDAGFANNKIR